MQMRWLLSKLLAQPNERVRKKESYFGGVATHRLPCCQDVVKYDSIFTWQLRKKGKHQQRRNKNMFTMDGNACMHACILVIEDEKIYKCTLKISVFSSQIECYK